jgi:hypothetical protein
MDKVCHLQFEQRNNPNYHLEKQQSEVNVEAERYSCIIIFLSKLNFPGSNYRLVKFLDPFIQE